MKIAIDEAQVQAQINSLTSLLAKCNTESSNTYTCTSKGKASEAVLACLNGYNTLEEGLHALITITIRFLENAKDGYLDADDELAKLCESVLGGQSENGGE